MREFTYKGAARLRVLLNQVGGVLALVFGTSILVALVIAGLLLKRQDVIQAAGCIGVWALLIGWIVGFGLINYYPTVWVGEQGVSISFFVFWRVMIPWSEIIAVRPSLMPFGKVLVQARRITPFHRLYGWLHSLTFRPSFIIGPGIQDRDELLREISKRMHVKHVR